MVDLDRVKQQLVIDDDDQSQDILLTGYLSAAKFAVKNHVNRVVYWDPSERPQDPLTVPEHAIDASADFELAALLLVGHYYKNREAVSDVSQSQIPLGVSFLINPYRVINL